eukprot:comp22455_c0_seq2/m.55263 comp22455_c0_seq2/g.55263  ORF comp22455_c0_seq2/g.55263 comp22455_c0_seq2/m.55263 type:complete len:1314 (-) comp22455_c0_seq2:157-4098(-)
MQQQNQQNQQQQPAALPPPPLQQQFENTRPPSPPRPAAGKRAMSHKNHHQGHSLSNFHVDSDQEDHFAGHGNRHNHSYDGYAEHDRQWNQHQTHSYNYGGGDQHQAATRAGAAGYGYQAPQQQQQQQRSGPISPERRVKVVHPATLIMGPGIASAPSSASSPLRRASAASPAMPTGSSSGSGLRRESFGGAKWRFHSKRGEANTNLGSPMPVAQPHTHISPERPQAPMTPVQNQTSAQPPLSSHHIPAAHIPSQGRPSYPGAQTPISPGITMMGSPQTSASTITIVHPAVSSLAAGSVIQSGHVSPVPVAVHTTRVASSTPVGPSSSPSPVRVHSPSAVPLHPMTSNVIPTIPISLSPVGGKRSQQQTQPQQKQQPQSTVRAPTVGNGTSSDDAFLRHPIVTGLISRLQEMQADLVVRDGLIREANLLLTKIQRESEVIVEQALGEAEEKYETELAEILKNTQGSREQLVLELQQAVDSLGESESQHREAMKASVEERDKLQRENSSLRHRVSLLESEVDDVRRNQQAANAQLATELLAVRRRNDELEQVAMKLEVTETERDNLQRRNGELADQVADLESQVRNLKELTRKFTDTLDSARSEALERITELEKSILEHSSENDMLKTQLSTMKPMYEDRIRGLLVDNEELTTRNTKLELESDSVSEAYRALSAEFEALASKSTEESSSFADREAQLISRVSELQGSLRSAEDKVQMLSTTLRNTEAVLVRLRDAVTGLELEADKSHERVDELQEQLHVKMRENAELTEIVSGLSRIREVQDETIEELTAVRDAMEAKFDEMMQGMDGITREREQLELSLGEYMDDTTSLRRDKQDLSSKLASILSTSTQVARMNQNLKVRVAELEKLCESQRHELDDHMTKTRMQSDLIDELQGAMRGSEKQLNLYQAQLDKIKTGHDGLASKLEKRDSTISELERILDGAQEARGILEAQIDAYAKQIGDLKRDHESRVTMMREEFERTMTAIRGNYEATQEHLRREVEISSSLITQLRDERDKLHSTCTEQEKAIEQLHAAVDAAESENRNLLSTVSEMEAILDRVQDQLAATQSKLNEAAAQHEVDLQQIKELEFEFARSGSQVASLRTENARLRDIASVNESLRANLAETQKLIEQMRTNAALDAQAQHDKIRELSVELFDARTRLRDTMVSKAGTLLELDSLDEVKHEYVHKFHDMVKENAMLREHNAMLAERNTVLNVSLDVHRSVTRVYDEGDHDELGTLSHTRARARMWVLTVVLLRCMVLLHIRVCPCARTSSSSLFCCTAQTFNRNMVITWGRKLTTMTMDSTIRLTRSSTRCR